MILALQQMSEITKSDHILLLDVFRIGLRFQLITLQQVLSWVDEIINNGHKSDEFFITLAQIDDEKQLLWYLIKNAPFTADIIPIRVIIGIAFYKLVKGEISVKTFSNTCEELPNGFTAIEYKMTGEIVSYSLSYPDERFIGIILGRWPMLARYKDLNLSNTDEWGGINDVINVEISKLQEKENARNKTQRKYRDEKRAGIKQKKYIAFTGISLFALVIISVNYQLLTNNNAVKIFAWQLDELTIWQINIAAGVFFIMLCYTIWKLKRKRR